MSIIAEKSASSIVYPPMRGCNGQVKQDTFLSSLLIEFPLKFQRGLVA